MKKNVRSRRRALRQALRSKKTVTVIYLVLRALVIATLVLQFLNGNFENVFLCGLTLVLFTLPTVIERRIKIDLPDTLEIIILLFIFAAEILGEIQAYYTIFKGWDTMLHTLNGFLCAAIGFSLVDLLNRNERFSLSLSPAFMSIVAFCFSMTIGVLWEFFECGMDQLLLLDMQKDAVVHEISSVMLDPAGRNTPTVIRGITDVIVVGHRLAGYDEGFICQFYWRGRFFLDWLFLCEEPGTGPVCQPVYSKGFGQKQGMIPAGAAILEPSQTKEVFQYGPQ